MKFKLNFLSVAVILFVILAVGRVIMWGYETPPAASPPTIAPPAPSQNVKPAVIRTPTLIEGSFKLKVNLPFNEETLVRYMIPLDPQTGKPKASASNMVFYAPYTGNAPGIRRGLKPWQRYFAEKLGYTIFSLSIDNGNPILYDKEHFYIYREVGWFEVIFKIKQRLEKQFKLIDKPLLIIGESSGSSMAQRMAVAYPDKIAGCAWVGGGTYKPFKQKLNIAWLATNVWSGGGIPATKQFQQQAEALGMQVLRCEASPNWKTIGGKYFHHAGSKVIYKLIQTFIKGIVELRDNNHGIVPSPEKWPVTVITCGKKRFMPSKEFATLWQKLPHELSRRLASGNTKGLLIYPPPAHPDKIVMFAVDVQQLPGVVLEDCLDFTTNKNMVATAVNIGDAPLLDIKIADNALKELIKKSQWKNLDIYLVGSGMAGQILAIAGLKNGSTRIKKITLLNSEYDYYTPKLSILAQRKSSTIPLIIYNDFIKSLPVEMTHTILKKQPKLGNPAKNWYKILNQAVVSNSKL